MQRLNAKRRICWRGAIPSFSILNVMVTAKKAKQCLLIHLLVVTTAAHHPNPLYLWCLILIYILCIKVPATYRNYSCYALPEQIYCSLNIWPMFLKLTTAKGPSSILAAIHGFQFCWGGDHGTTPGRVWRWVESSNSSRLRLMRIDLGSSLVPSCTGTQHERDTEYRPHSPGS